MAGVTLEKRVSALEQQVNGLATRDDVRAVAEDVRTVVEDVRTVAEDVRTVAEQVLHLGTEMRSGFSAIREEIRAGDEESRRFMRMLHEDVIDRLAKLRG